MRITLKISFRLIQVKLNSRRWNETNFATYNNPFFLILLHHFRKMLRIFHKICFQLFYSKKKIFNTAKYYHISRQAYNTRFLSERVNINIF